jgi:hypothetical protein
MLIFGEAHLRRILLSMPAIILLSMPAIIMKCVLTYRCAKMRRSVEQFNDTEPFSLRPFWLACIIATCGYNFRKGTGAARRCHFKPMARADTNRLRARRRSRRRFDETAFLKTLKDAVDAELI